MTNIKATCPQCGEVEVTAADIALLIARTEESSTYGFECPTCISHISKPADSRIIQLLLSGGVEPTILDDDPRAFDGPLFTYDDLLDFHLELQAEDDLAGLLAEG
ncbi:MAG: hypothetical protein ABIS18_07320 [Actinomycetota bacterium]